MVFFASPAGSFASSGEAGVVREESAAYGAGDWRAVGQIYNTYILAQSSDGLLIVDQHSAQEQVFFEWLTNPANPGSAPAAVFRPVVIELLPAEAQRLSAHLDAYRSLGIALEPFGGTSFRVESLPTFVGLPAAELLAALEEYRVARERLLSVLGPRMSNRDPLAEFAEHFVAALMGGRLAVTPEQAEGAGLPPKPGTDRRYNDGYPHISYEAEALGQTGLNRLLAG